MGRQIGALTAPSSSRPPSRPAQVVQGLETGPLPAGRDRDHPPHRLPTPAENPPGQKSARDAEEQFRCRLGQAPAQAREPHPRIDQHRHHPGLEECEDEAKKSSPGLTITAARVPWADAKPGQSRGDPVAVLVKLAIGQMAVADPPRRFRPSGTTTARVWGRWAAIACRCQAIFIGPSRAAGKLERSKACVGSSSRSGPPRRGSGRSGDIDAVDAVASTQDTKEKRGMPGALEPGLPVSGRYPMNETNVEPDAVVRESSTGQPLIVCTMLYSSPSWTWFAPWFGKTRWEFFGGKPRNWLERTIKRPAPGIVAGVLAIGPDRPARACGAGDLS